MTVSQLTSFHSFCSQSKRPPPESHRGRVGLGQGALLLARAVLAAAALPLLGAAVRRAACARDRRADVLAAALARARHRAAQFPPGPTEFQHWRMVSYINMAKPFMRHELRFAAVR